MLVSDFFDTEARCENQAIQRSYNQIELARAHAYDILWTSVTFLIKYGKSKCMKVLKSLEFVLEHAKITREFNDNTTYAHLFTQSSSKRALLYML